MGTRFIHVDIKHGYNPIMICYARRLISQTCCANTVSTVGGCILSCRPLSSEDISLLMIKFLVFPIATTQDVVGVCLNRIGKQSCCRAWLAQADAASVSSQTRHRGSKRF